MRILFKEVGMQTTLNVRKATIADISFLARIEYEASLPPLNHCFWEDILQDTGTSVLEFIEAKLRTNASNWGFVSDFSILEEEGQPVAAAAGYTPNTEDYCPLRLSCLAKISQALNWSSAVATAFCDRYEQFWGSDSRPFFLTPQTPWINGNDVARHTYESIGFKPYQTFHAEYFSQQFNLDFPGITKFGICLN
jgi:hypothetical protein